jgi:predicted PurR-regulated permease PerM
MDRTKAESRTHPAAPAAPSLGRFTGQVLIVILIGGLAAALLLFAACLLAIGLRAASGRLSHHLRIGPSFALTLVVVIGSAAFAAALWLFGSVVAEQVDLVLQAVPAGFRLTMEWLKSNPYGALLLDQARSINVVGATGWATSMVTAAMGWITRGVGYAILTLFVAIYLAAQPQRYRHLALRLIPPTQRATVGHLFDVVGDVLRRWLAGQLLVMAVVGVLIGAGLYLLGIGAAFALGLMAGLLCFIPYVGTILSAIPAVLVALTQGPGYALMVVVIFCGVHFVEGDLITPLVQAKATEMPPVLAILSTVAFSLLFGASGVLLAAPLTLLVLAVVEVLYVQHGLGEPAESDKTSHHEPPKEEKRD